MLFKSKKRKKLEFDTQIAFENWQNHKDDSSFSDLESASKNLINWIDHESNADSLANFEEALEYINMMTEDYYEPLEEMKNESKKISKSITSLKNDTLTHEIGPARIEYYQACESYFNIISKKLDKIEL